MTQNLATTEIALPNATAGEYAGYAGYNGGGYGWECWHEYRDARTGEFKAGLCDQSNWAQYSDLDHATIELTEHMIDAHGLVQA